MLEMNLIVVVTIYEQSTKFVSEVKFKATGKINNNKQPLFNLGSVYSIKASGVKQTTKTNNPN